MMLHDFKCRSCSWKFEALVQKDQYPLCPECGHEDIERLVTGNHQFSVIVPTTRDSKKRKAGYQHTHADRPKTPGRVQVGYTGPSKY